MPCTDTPHAPGLEQSSHAATADSSMAVAEPPGGAVLAGELPKPSASSLAGEQAPHKSSSASDAEAAGANAEHKGEHDFMVATGYTGRPPGSLPLLRWVNC